MKIRADKDFADSDLKKLQIIIVPFYKYRNYDKGEKEINSLKKLIPDSSFKSVCYRLEYTDGHLFCFPVGRAFKAAFYYDIDELPPDMESLFFYQFPKTFNLSDNLICINLLGREWCSLDPYAMYDGNQVKCIDHDTKEYRSINDFILKRYGSVEKYIEMCIEDTLRSALFKKMTLEDCKKIFRNDYVYWERYLPLDTTGILNAFVEEVDSFAQLQPHQSTFLIKRLKEDVRTGASLIDCRYEFSLLQKDITHTMNMTLTDEQLSRYRKYLRLKGWLQGQAMYKLESYYLGERKIPIEKEDEIFKKEVYPNKDNH